MDQEQGNISFLVYKINYADLIRNPLHKKMRVYFTGI